MKTAAEMIQIASERNRIGQEAAEQEDEAMMNRIHQRTTDLLAKIEKQIEDSAKLGRYEVEFRFIPIDGTENNCGMDLTAEGHAIYSGIINTLHSNGFTVVMEEAFDTWNLTIRWEEGEKNA